MENKKNVNKLLFIGISVGVVLIVGAITAIVLFKFMPGNKDKPSPQTPSVQHVSEHQKLVNKGTDSESKGDTESALENYKAARDLCEKNDEQCKNDMDAKIDMMNMYLKQEKKRDAAMEDKRDRKSLAPDQVYDETKPPLGPSLPYDRRQ